MDITGKMTHNKSELIYPFFLGFVTTSWCMILFGGFSGWFIGVLLVLIMIMIKTICEIWEEDDRNDKNQ